MKGLAMLVVRSPVSLLCSDGVFDAIRIERMPSTFLPRLAIAIIALLPFLPGLAVILNGVMSKHFAIDMGLFRICHW
jgi:hypothetical protein